jgi:hypothetical protein
METTAMRTVIIAMLVAALSGVAYAADDSLDKAAKKTADGFGNLLGAMGQEIKKMGDEDKKDAKKEDAKAEAKKPGPKADPNPKGDRP